MGFFRWLFGSEKELKQNAQHQDGAAKQSAQAVCCMNPPSKNLDADIENILREEFSTFKIARAVAASSLDANQTYGEADFVIIDGVKPVAAIMLIEQGKFRTKRVYGVEKACRAKNIAFISLYRHFPFSREHVVVHINKKMGK